MIRINLLPVRAAQKKEKLVAQVVILTGSLVLAIAVCVALQTLLSAKIDDTQNEIRQAEADIKTLNKKIGEVDKIKKLTAELENKRKVLSDLEAGRKGPVRILDELSLAIPEKVWIDSFQVNGANVAISGTGLTEEDIAVFLRALENSDYYQNVDLEVIKSSKMGNSFKLKCALQNPAKKKT